MLVSIAVYDLGGGTFDISILEIQKGVFEVNKYEAYYYYYACMLYMWRDIPDTFCFSNCMHIQLLGSDWQP